MNMILPGVIVLFVFSSLVSSRLGVDNNYFKLRFNTTELVQNAGYPLQQFSVTTDDGYILPVFRLPRENHPPVLLVHGLMTASDSWLLQPPGRDLAYQMYDAGYDVWFGDFRGDFYTRKHVSLSPDDPLFWQFSWHEMATYDLPVMIDLVLNTTGYEQISYVGHSMGTTTFFVLGSERPQYMSKIRVFVGMGPVAAWSPHNLDADKKILFGYAAQAMASFQRQGIYEIVPRTWFAPHLSRMFCSPGSPTQFLCFDLLFFWAGSTKHRISQSTLPMVLSHAPAGLCLYSALHYLQAINGVFGPLDYGEEVNLRKYGRIYPGLYDISRVTCPVSLHYSSGDWVVNSSDVEENIKRLPNVVEARKYSDLSHVDYIWGRSAWREIYPNVISTLDRFHNSPR